MCEVWKNYFGHCFQSSVWAIMGNSCFAPHRYCFLLLHTIQHWLSFWSLPWLSASCHVLTVSHDTIRVKAEKRVVKAEKRVAKFGTCTTAAEKQVVGKKIAKPLYKITWHSSSSSPKYKLEIKLFSCNPEYPQITWNIDTDFHIYTSHMKALFPEMVSVCFIGVLCAPHLYHCKETGHWEPTTCITTLTGTSASCPHYSTASLWR